jgi:hypothetical protein
MFSISAMIPSCFRIIVNKQGEVFVSYCLVNLGFTLVDRIRIDADTLNIWQLSVPHNVLLFQPFFPVSHAFYSVFYGIITIKIYHVLLQGAYQSTTYSGLRLTGQCCIHCLHFNLCVFHFVGETAGE